MFGRMLRLKPGHRAPDFTLPLAGTGDQTLRLSEQLRRGPVVLLFFPFAFSPGCGQELADFEAQREAFERQGSTILGVSVDSPFVLRALAEHLSVTFPLLSDFNRTVCRRYGVLLRRWGLNGFANRAVFLIDPPGRIRWCWTAPDLGILPDPAKVFTILCGFERSRVQSSTTASKEE